MNICAKKNAVAGNPVDGVKRSMTNGNEGSMPAWEKRLSVQQIADVQAYLKTLKPPPPP
jgi:mono/diheme cytochrome c family protein